ncbi:MAG: hypothetical protein U0840_11640 [Gemmataceae bacterium]
MLGPDSQAPGLTNHYTVLLYPFVHALGEGAARQKRLALLGQRWQSWWVRPGEMHGRADEISVIHHKLEASDFFLPHARALLYPETTLLEAQPPGWRCSNWISTIRQLGELPLEQMAEQLPSDGVLHLTARPAMQDYLRHLSVLPPPDYHGTPGQAIDVELLWADLYLFHAHWGFLALKLRLRDRDADIDRLMELNRNLAPIQPRWLAGRSALVLLRDGSQWTMGEWLSFLLQGLVEPELPGTLTPAGPVRLPDEHLYTDSHDARAYGPRCLMLSYACVPGADTVEPGVFTSGADRLLYELAMGMRLDDSIASSAWVPTREMAENVLREHRFHDWNCWRGLMVKDGCYFLGTEAGGFADKQLPFNVTRHYLPLYVYALHQHFSLLRFARTLTLEVARTDLHLFEARELLRGFIAFRNRYWFNVVTARPQGNRLYRLVQEGLEVPASFALVANSVQGARDYYEGQWNQELGKLRLVLGLGKGLLLGVSGGASMWLMQFAWFKYAASLGGAAVLLFVLVFCLPEHSALKAALRRWLRTLGGSWKRTPASPSPEMHADLPPVEELPRRRAA